MKIDERGVLREDDGRISPCPKCGKRWEYEIGHGKAGHYASARCKACGHFWWLPKPDRDKAKRPAKQSKLVKRYSRGFCELCLIPEAKVPRCESLTAHHVLEYQDGGDESRENIWILCTRCEKLVHHQRTYIGHLLNGGDNAEPDSKKRPADDAVASQLDSLEDGSPRERQADEGADPADRAGSEFNGPDDLDQF